ncbi:MAG: hypothetical protein K0S49_2851, partial [Microbacterium sp.]|nr:hypothetical protein [Microbacterium sp.]
LRRTRALATDAGVGLSAGLPAAHPDRVTSTWGTDPLSPAHAYAQIAAAEALGVESLHVTVGQDDDRFRSEPSWADQLERTVPVLQQLVACRSCSRRTRR